VTLGDNKRFEDPSFYVAAASIRIDTRPMDFFAAFVPDAYPAAIAEPSQLRMQNLPRKFVGRRHRDRGAFEQQSARIQHHVATDEKIEKKARHASGTGQYGWHRGCGDPKPTHFRATFVSHFDMSTRAVAIDAWTTATVDWTEAISPPPSEPFALS
jgi:hypothetical protein